MRSSSASETHSPATRHCVLMFSGGRDSTLAALRLHEQGYTITLATVKSNHLFGINQVRQRLRELRTIIPTDTQWMTIRQPEELRTDTSFYEMTCLPCHHAYVVVSVALAHYLGTRYLAFGYAGYQNTWPEQTPLATSRLRSVLAQHGIELLLPVYDLLSREQVETVLSSYGVAPQSLEQKCLQQVNNVELSTPKLSSQISLWEQAIESSLRNLSLIETDPIEIYRIGEI